MVEILNAEIKTRIEMISRGEVPEGYKKTKVGIIPEDWEVCRLGEVAEIVSGGTPSTKIKEYWDGEIPWCTPTDITSSSKYIENTTKYISKEGLNNSSAQLLPANSILMCSRATIGPHSINKVPMATNQGFKSFICKKDKLYFEFLYYLLDIHVPAFIRKANGSTFLEISKHDVKKTMVSRPNLIEQQKIAQILSTWDEAIELKEKLIEQKKQQKKGLMQKLLTGEVRLPGFDGEWEEVRLGDIGKCIRGVSYKPDDLLDKKGEESITLLRANNIIDFRINHKEVQYVKKNNVKKEQLIQDKDIVIAMSSGSLKSVGKTGFCTATEMGMCVGAFCAIYRTNNIEFAEYIKHFFETDLYSKQLIGMLEGTNINNLKNSDIESLKIKIPKEVSEVKKVSNLLSISDKEIDLLNQELKLLKLQKKGLMQLLLTGIVRVN